MQITNETQVQKFMQDSATMQDGLTLFIGQGQIAVDVCSYSDAGEESEIEVLFQVDIYKRKEEFSDHDTFFSIDHINGQVSEEFDLSEQEFYTTEKEANERVLALMMKHSSFSVE